MAIREISGWWKAIHVLVNMEEDSIIVNELVQVVLVENDVG